MGNDFQWFIFGFMVGYGFCLGLFLLGRRLARNFAEKVANEITKALTDAVNEVFKKDLEPRGVKHESD